MRGGKKTQAETRKTRPCIVYVKNLKESEASGVSNQPNPGKQTRIVRKAAVKGPTPILIPIPTRRSQAQAQADKRREETTRTTRRTASIGNVESLQPARRQTPATPKATRGTRKPEQQEEPPQPQESIASAKTKMYKQSKLAVTPVSTPPPTIAASRSRRSIKPNPKYASEDMVTPRYVAAMGSDSPGKRTAAGKQLFAAGDDADDDDEEGDLHDFIEEDNDDELNDAAFNPQHHKSDDDDDISEGEFEQQLRREKIPPKRGRGRPPKNPQAAAANAAAAAAAARAQTQSQARAGVSQGAAGGRAGVTQLQQLRRSIAANNNLARSQLTRPQLAGQLGNSSSNNNSNKRKLEDHGDAPAIARKRLAAEALPGRPTPVINGSTSVAKTTAVGLAKSKLMLANSSSSSNNNNNGSGSGAGGVRLVQATGAKQRPTSSSSASFKLGTSTAASRGPGLARTGTVGRPPGSGLKKAQSQSLAGGAAAAASVKLKLDAEDVPTFTIVNIDDIINQDDVLITRSSNSSNNNNNNNNSNKKLTPAARNNNNNNSSSSGNSNSRSNQLQSSSAPATGSASSSAPSNNLSKRLKPGVGGAAAAAKSASSLALNHSKAEAKPRPRILNAEMGRKTQPMMKPLMSMGQELCGDTEDEDMSLDLADDDDSITISPQAATAAAAPAAGGGGGAGGAAAAGAASQPAAKTQTRVVRHGQASSKWLPAGAVRRNVLATTTTPANASNHQRQQLQQHQQQLHGAAADRKLTKLLGESSDDDVVFKKPASPSSAGGTTLQQQRRSKENALALDEDAAAVAAAAAAGAATGAGTGAGAVSETDCKPPKYFPPETTTYCEEDGRIVKKITCYETWHVISTPKELTLKARQQRTCLELPLVKLANVAARIKVPSSKWTSKVTLYKVSPSLMQRQTMTIFTGDLKSYNIPEEERHKYQPSCVLFRRSVLNRSKCRVPFDRAIIFKNKCFYANIEGKHVNLLGAPEVVSSVKDVEMLIDIVDSLALSSDLVEMVTSK
ncbi:hypothetical protein KR222_009858 [Zaprionus bogoriensis]|nr:hypothetical protein KR222_009858 [Zaprionus bogoriensis]